VLTEIVANALDSGPSAISLRLDASASTLTVVDNGSGMRRADLRRFHDVAASGKTRGESIGFAGVGIKLGLLVSAEVVTESRRGKDHVATSWALLGHFEPLFDSRFDEVLAEHYPQGVRFDIDGRIIARRDTPSDADDIAPVAVRLARKRKPSAVGYLARSSLALPEDRRGVAISTYGKVIKRGWDWLGLSPAMATRVSGLIEAPALASSLTLNKVDFIRTGPRGAMYMAYRKALQEAISQQLAIWNDEAGDVEETHRRATRPVERDVEEVLAGLADRFPLLALLADRRPGGTDLGVRFGSASPSSSRRAPISRTSTGSPRRRSG
jgi:hypothetical protein